MTPCCVECGSQTRLRRYATHVFVCAACFVRFDYWSYFFEPQKLP